MLTMSIMKLLKYLRQSLLNNFYCWIIDFRIIFIFKLNNIESLVTPFMFLTMKVLTGLNILAMLRYNTVSFLYILWRLNLETAKMILVTAFHTQPMSRNQRINNWLVWVVHELLWSYPKKSLYANNILELRTECVDTDDQYFIVSWEWVITCYTHSQGLCRTLISKTHLFISCFFPSAIISLFVIFRYSGRHICVPVRTYIHM